MGSNLSKTSFTAHQSSQNILQDQSESSDDLPDIKGPPSSPDINSSGPSPTISLYTRLAVYEKELRDAQLEIARKEVVIQYLLSDASSKARSEGYGEGIDQRILVLEEQIRLLVNDSAGINNKFQEVLKIVTDVSTPDASFQRPGKTSITSSTCKGSDSGNEKQEDLIDLLDCQEACQATKSDGPTSKTCGDDVTDEEDCVLQPALNPNQAQSSSPDFLDSPYIHHFGADGNGSTAIPNKANLNLKPTPGPPSSMKATSLLAKLEECNTSTNSEEFPSGYTSPTSVSMSASSSFNLTSEKDPKSLSASQDLSQFRNSQSVNNAQGVTEGTIAPHLRIKEPKTMSSASNLETALSSLPPFKDSAVKMGDSKLFPMQLRWKIGNLFKSEQERERVVSVNRHEVLNGGERNMFPDLFRYGIRYIPRNNERDVYRTVIISGLPSNMTLMKLLGKVRGGMVIDASILDTTAITQGRSALVTFLHENSAVAYKNYTAEHPLKFDGSAARVDIVRTPTWPIPANLLALIHQGRTRCFEARKFPNGTSITAIKRQLTKSSVMKSSSLESIEMAKDNVLSLRFASVMAAGNKAAHLQRTRSLSGCVIKYVPDPCAQTLDTLLKPDNIDHVLNGDSVQDILDCPLPDFPLEESEIVNQSCRLEKVNLDSEPETRWGRGFSVEIQ